MPLSPFGAGLTIDRRLHFYELIGALIAAGRVGARPEEIAVALQALKKFAPISFSFFGGILGACIFSTAVEAAATTDIPHPAKAITKQRSEIKHRLVTK